MAQNIDYAHAAPDEVEVELGKQLEELRLSKNINQTQLANEAGISRRTVTRLENGEGISLDTLIRVMRALGVADRLQLLIPSTSIRPIDRVRLKGGKRKHASNKKRSESAPWTWNEGDEAT